MKTISIPNPIVLRNPDNSIAMDDKNNPVSVSFKDFVCQTLLVDPKFGKGMADLLSAVEIKTRIKEAQDEVILENADYERLLEVATSPSVNFNPAVGIQIVDFFLAIKNAK
jgi:hypothetical protein